jgi:hypothetical protein
MAAEITHATGAQLAAISTAHGIDDAAIVARVVAVADTLSAGVTVKTLAADLVTASAKDPRIIPVGQSVLGYAKAVGDVLHKLGVSLETAVAENPRMVAETYRAVMRQGRASILKSVPAAGMPGKSTSAKLARAQKAATAEVDAAKAERKVSPAKTRTTTVEVSPEADVHTDGGPARVVRGITASIVSGKFTPDDNFRAAVAALAEALTVAKVAPSPAKVATAVAAK